MELKEDRDALIAAAAGWDGIAIELGNARNDLLGHEHEGSEFGWFASRAGIPEKHNTFIAAMMAALLDGVHRANDIADALRNTAKDFGATDVSVADTFHNADGTPR